MRKFIIIFMSLFIVIPAVAQAPLEAEMLTERDTEAERQCGVSNEGLLAAAAGVMRRSGFQITPATGGRGDGLVVYVKAHPIRIQGGCAVHLNVRFFFAAYSLAPWGAYYRSPNILCDRSSSRTGPNGTMQASLRSDVAELTEKCISREEQVRGR